MFENPRRGRQARNFTTNVPKILDLKSSSEQIFFRKLSLGAPVYFFVMILDVTFLLSVGFLLFSTYKLKLISTVTNTFSIWLSPRYRNAG